MAVRTQIYLSEKLYKRVKARAAKTGKSMAEQIRESLERYLDEKEAAEAKPDDPIWKLAGQVQSKAGDLSSKHDTYLYGKENKR